MRFHVPGSDAAGRSAWRAAVRFHVWQNSTAYKHCFFIIPIAAYLAWDRRSLLAGVPIRPAPWLALTAVLLTPAWLIAERIGAMEGRQLVALGFVQLLFMSLLGWPLWRRLSAASLYLFFLVPFGAFIVALLQTITARFAVAGLDVLGIPNFSDRFTIEIPAGTFYVAEACTGLRFLIASIAFGTLYACLMYRSPMRRLAFVIASVIIPVIANGLRALGIVVLGQVLGSAEAAAADHVLYGWIFFSIVIFVLTVVGLPFRQDPHWRAPPEMERPGKPASVAATWLAALALGVLAAMGPVVAGRLADAAGTAVTLAAPAFDGSGPCVPVGGATPIAPGAEASAAVSGVVQHFACGADHLTLRIAVFPPRTGLSHLVAAQRTLSGTFEGADADILPLRAAGIGWRLTETESPPGAAATALWIDGQPAGGGFATRLLQARNSLLGSERMPVVAVVTPDIAWNREGKAGRVHARALVQAFLDSQPDLPAKLTALADRTP